MTLNIWVSCIIVLSGTLWAISAVIKSWPGNLPNVHFFINVFTPFGVNGLGVRVIESGLSRKSYILFSIEGMVKLFGLKNSKRCCL